ncbi:MAG: hypothetical protein OWQ59_10295 [Alicyclobacillaceae bacterium]|jgi:hypothetical protein|uniref:hypothetical protein n=1 Tax=Alicyclobacillus sp. SP_1 TaxID=2942475 RepID=UPI00215872DE|nr:hypothetical protein [Alicyclobacillus sp. SP_1]MCY0888833.1 hypothetical protein [Alicyclobacillaceae bacterium]MCY0897111.1 hypothetical protein [Alicyclobacillaceae bacterium]
MEQFLSPSFAIGTIRIGQIEGASCMNLGNNWPTNFRSYKKHNQGFGSVSGDHSVVRDLRSLLHDPDNVDTFSLVGDTPPEWLLSLLNRGDEELRHSSSENGAEDT